MKEIRKVSNAKSGIEENIKRKAKRVKMKSSYTYKDKRGITRTAHTGYMKITIADVPGKVFYLVVIKSEEFPKDPMMLLTNKKPENKDFTKMVNKVYIRRWKVEEYFRFHKKVIHQLLRITSKYIFYIVQPVTGNKRALYKLLGEFHENIKEVIIWNKISGQPAMAQNVMNSVFEYIIVFAKDTNDSISRQFKESNFKRGTLNNVWNIKRKQSVSKEHSATFPEELIDEIIMNFTQENEIILDPFSGTGTTGVSCIKHNRKYIGIELLENYYNISIERLKNYK